MSAIEWERDLVERPLVNQSATDLLLRGTVVEGPPQWEHGRSQPVNYIDFADPENNNFLEGLLWYVTPSVARAGGNDRAPVASWPRSPVGPDGDRPAPGAQPPAPRKLAPGIWPPSCCEDRYA